MVRDNVVMNRSIWFRVGGAADVLFSPEDEEELATGLSVIPQAIPRLFLGLGSNMLIRDGGFRGVIIQLGRPFRGIEVQGNRITAGAGAIDAKVANAAATAGLAGLEFLKSVPGAIGGALRMNAGCYGREVSDILVECHGLTAQGKPVHFTREDMGFSYRKCSISEDVIFTRATFEGTPDDPQAIQDRMDEMMAKREATQPIRERTGGSTFKNPDGHKAWELIDAAGCRGLTVGGAQMSEHHCNFMINTGSATAQDLETLGETVRQRVKETSGIDLNWEIKRVGVPSEI
jgi:UDP-N-acetylmuramate dehydrogenase